LTQPSEELQQTAISTIRTLSIDAIQKANSGHPGLPMGAASMAYTLWTQLLRHNPKNPAWPDRDRFVLSAGHGSMLLYSLLHLTGYDVSMDDLKNFRQLDSKTPGHPEFGTTAGVETTTGPLGQGAVNAVGMALAEAFLAKTFNRPGHKIVNHHTYAIVGDGDMMEGLCMEAVSLAGHWGLGKLTFLYDSNDITLNGKLEESFSENVAERFHACGWHVLTVEEGDDVEALEWAISDAKINRKSPTLIIVKTIIGQGSPNMAGKNAAHGSPLGAEEIKLTKEALGLPADKDFYIRDDVLAHFREAVTKGAELESQWTEKFEAWRAEFPDLAQQWDEAMSGKLPDSWDKDLRDFPADLKTATRSSSGRTLCDVAHNIPTMIGGDADIAMSTKTRIENESFTAKGEPAHRNLRFGVREHAMGAIVNGLALHGGIIRPYSATFMVFSDYMRHAIRLGALMNLQTLYIFTHDSIGVGEDGPTHQPIEHVMSLRLIPNLHVFRPAEANEVAAMWQAVMELDGPATMALTRQNLPTFEDIPLVRAGVKRGAYVIADSDDKPEVILLATGSEVHIALEAYETLKADGVKARVVSMPCWELFDAQDADYKESVIPADVTARVSIEAGVTSGWQKYTGMSGINIGIDRFGTSGPMDEVYEAFGLTAEALVEAAKGLLK
jgi:transketolase